MNAQKSLSINPIRKYLPVLGQDFSSIVFNPAAFALWQQTINFVLIRKRYAAVARLVLCFHFNPVEAILIQRQSD